MLNYFLFLLVFVFGLIIGSFLNCVIYRLELKEIFLNNKQREKTSFWRGRSFCPHCQQILAWYDLVPIFSFIFLRGKCRYCQQKISWQYPLVEIATGFLFWLIFLLQFDLILQTDFAFNQAVFNYLNLFYYWLIAAFLVVIFVFDLKHYLIPDQVIYPAIIMAGIYSLQFLFSSEFSIFLSLLLSGLGAAAFFLSIVLLSRGRWLGVGDIKLAFLMGLLLGWPAILAALLLAFYIGAIIGLGLIFSGRKKIKSEIPFGPFLAVGTLLVLFWGEELVSWYQGLLLFS